MTKMKSASRPVKLSMVQSVLPVDNTHMVVTLRTGEVFYIRSMEFRVTDDADVFAIVMQGPVN